MAKVEIVVTDVTCYGSLFCVAGFDVSSARMVRPEPPTANAVHEASRFWDAQWAGPGRIFSVGNVVRFEAVAAPDNFPFPHATEDCLVDPKTITLVKTIQPSDLPTAVATSVSKSISAAFDGALVRANNGKAYVEAGQTSRSLGAIQVNPKELHFFENTYDAAKPKLRASITCEGTTYDLPVTAEATRRQWQVDGIEKLNADVAARNLAHVRLGLARPFAGMPCYAQINGLCLL